ncbi:MAG: hypothetical protein A2Y14_05135 [Verrucomicrobia bacterium GWF2_51_19]|nr:MAG: hypothetical protein A2Y14_05135 [Verrucomicrobia bacterium GWF2_51_19]HCJ12484.1 dicarboxylate/amino acid:cation symporter [Opitutae bacterium]
MKRKYPLHWKIVIALSLAALLACILRIFGMQESSVALGSVDVCHFVGNKLFMNALKMVVVPLVGSSIICGMMGLDSAKEVGRMGLRTLLFSFSTTAASVVVGAFCINVMQPGFLDLATVKNILGTTQIPTAAFTDLVDHAHKQDFLSLFDQIIPSNVIAAATNNSQLLGLITFCLLFGFGITLLPVHLRIAQRTFWESLHQVMLKVTDVIIRFAPWGVFSLVFPVFLRAGTGVIWPLMYFVITVMVGFLLQMIVLGAFLFFWGGINPLHHYRAMLPVMLTAFSTASSASTLPVTLEAVQTNAGVSNRVASFTLPLGCAFNMSGTALYECVVVLFIAQMNSVVTGVPITLANQIVIALFALITSMGVAGIPASGLVAITIILNALNLPLEAVGIIWVVERMLDMCRTAVNVFSDTCSAIIVAKGEGETLLYERRQD